MEKVYVNIDRYGNTSAASIPIAFCEALEEGRVKVCSLNPLTVRYASPPSQGGLFPFLGQMEYNTGC